MTDADTASDRCHPLALYTRTPTALRAMPEFAGQIQYNHDMQGGSHGLPLALAGSQLRLCLLFKTRRERPGLSRDFANISRVYLIKPRRQHKYLVYKNTPPVCATAAVRRKRSSMYKQILESGPAWHSLITNADAKCRARTPALRSVNRSLFLLLLPTTRTPYNRTCTCCRLPFQDHVCSVAIVHKLTLSLLRLIFLRRVSLVTVLLLALL